VNLRALSRSYSKGTKFRNIPTTADGIQFDSRAEARRYGELKLMERGRAISNLELQPTFRLDVLGCYICDYTADFRYVEAGATVVEDVKSKATRTPQYRIKVKLLKAIHGVTVKEIG
jgi:hypothetical protein